MWQCIYLLMSLQSVTAWNIIFSSVGTSNFTVDIYAEETPHGVHLLKSLIIKRAKLLCSISLMRCRDQRTALQSLQFQHRIEFEVTIWVYMASQTQKNIVIITLVLHSKHAKVNKHVQNCYYQTSIIMLWPFLCQVLKTITYHSVLIPNDYTSTYILIMAEYILHEGIMQLILLWWQKISPVFIFDNLNFERTVTSITSLRVQYITLT